MYGIGTVARLSQVSVRTLRHYDDLGLLKPTHVDPRTGYRYYSPDKVVRLHRILVFRDLGVPLSEIAELMDENVTVEQLRGILRLRQAEARVGSMSRPNSSSGSRSDSRNLRRNRWLPMK